MKHKETKTEKQLKEWMSKYESPNTFEKAVRTTKQKEEQAAKLFGRDVAKEEVKLSKVNSGSLLDRINKAVEKYLK